MPKTITYIITVHGIGEQRDNETLTPVASRFVDVIQDYNGTEKNPYPRNTLSLGQATGQEEANPHEHWASFEGLTMAKLESGDRDFIFYGCEADPHSDSDCLRFTDIYWQDILHGEWPLVGQDADLWVSTIVTRFFQDKAHPARLKSLLYTLEETVDILYYASKVKLKDLGTTVFEKFLGDVQLYTESPGCRKKAHDHFNQIMDGLHHAPVASGEEPVTNRYIIIAHSLGTVMALDALVAAAKEQQPWLENIEGFVTLGSPIDKIITLWDFNYKNLTLDPGQERSKKIPHYNYSDEQDPVGYYLNEIAAKPAYTNIFSKEEDIVYNRNVIPGLAHTSYWTDIELFRHIIRKIVLPKRQVFNDAKIWFKKGVYTGIMLVTYFLIPALMAVLNIVTLTMALGANGWQKQAISSFVFVATMWLGKQILSLTISWRLAANRGSNSEAVSFEEQTRNVLAKKSWNKGSKYLWAGMALSVFAPAYFFLRNPFHHTLSVTTSQFVPLAVMMVLSFFFLTFFFKARRKQQAIVGKYSSDQIATPLTFLLTLALLAGSVMLGNINIVHDKTSTAESSSLQVLQLLRQLPFPVSDALAAPQQRQQPRNVIKYDTIRKSVTVTDTVVRKIEKYDTIHRRITKTDTVREILKQDTGTSSTPPPASSGNLALLYFTALGNAFSCFTFSSLTYIFEKRKIRLMKAESLRSKGQEKKKA